METEPWTRPVPPALATEPLRSLYDAIASRSSRGHVKHLWQALGVDPTILESVFGAARAVFDDPAPLTAVQVELVALVVSATNGCAYCVAHHGPRLAKALDDENLARAVARDFRQADITARDRVMLDYAVALTCEPAERTRADLERVREYGFDDPTLVRLTALVAYCNHVNRLACALGVTLEPGVAPWEFGSQR